MKKIYILFLLLFIITPLNKAFAQDIYFINLKSVLNDSKAGSGAQEKLLKEFESQDKKFKDESNTLKKQETELLSQKKSLSTEDYKKKVQIYIYPYEVNE